MRPAHTCLRSLSRLRLFGALSCLAPLGAMLATPCVALAQGPAAAAIAAAGVPQAAIVGSVEDYPTIKANISRGDIVELRLPAHAPMDIALELPSTVLGNITLVATKRSLRGENFQILVTGPDGTPEKYDGVVPEVHYAGSAAGVGGSYATASLLHNGLVARVALPTGEALVVQPLSDFVPGAAAGLHVTYLSSDSKCSGTCGNIDGEPPAIGDGFGQGFETRGTCNAPICHAEIAVDMDYTYYQANDSDVPTTLQRMESILNTVTGLYNNQLGIGYVLSTTIVRTSEPDPYSSSDPSTLLGQFSNWWNANASTIPRDIAHLFTGTDLDGTVLGIANNPGVCNDPFAYGLSWASYRDDFNCLTDLVAHELGHNWGANHCDCPNHTMRATTDCANNMLDPAGQTAASILNRRNTVGCLSGTNAPPPNDTVATAQLVTNSLPVSVSTLNATNYANSSCGASYRDVFYRFSPPANGTATISLAVDFTSQISVFTGDPVLGAQEVACTNGDLLNFPIIAGGEYIVRIACRNIAVDGTGIMTITTPQPSNTCGSIPLVTSGQSFRSSFFGGSSVRSVPCVTSSSFNEDRMYRFIAPCSGTLNVSTCGSRFNNGAFNNPGANTVLVLSSTCQGAALVCNDEGNCGGVPWDARASVNLVGGQEVFIQATYTGGDFGNGSFQIGFTFTGNCVSNDACASAPRLLRNSPFAVVVDGSSSPDGSAACQANIAWNDVWYKFTAPQTGSASLSTCGTNVGDTLLSLHTGCPGTQANAIACSDNGACFSGNSLTAFLSAFVTQAQTYYVRVAAPQTSTLNVAFSQGIPASPTPDNPCGAAPLADGVAVVGSLFGLTPSGYEPVCQGGSTGQPLNNPDGWYRFTAPCEGVITFDTCGSRNVGGVGEGVDTVISAHRSCTNIAGSFANCNQDAAAGGCSNATDSRLEVPASAGETIYLRVTHYGQNQLSGMNNTMFNVKASFRRLAPAPGCPSICDDIDFNNDRLFPDDSDLVALLAVLAGGTCSTCSDIDFNNDGLFPDDSDLIAFLRVLAGGTCD